LGIGFMGLSDAFKKTATSGGSVVDRAYQIAQAERRVRDANREVLASQEALTRARRAAAENLEDLTRALAGAHLDEEAAVQSVADAQRDLDRARLSEDPGNIARATLAYNQAQQSLAEVRDRVQDLTDEQEDAARKGVEGSDQVTAALERQQQAVEAVGDATHDLREAQKPPAGGGPAEEVTKFAASALAAVAAIKALRPAWESLRLDVQEKLFAGVGGEITSLAAVWLPKLRERLGGMASMFNGLFREFAESAKNPVFVANISAGVESVERLIGRIGRSLAGPFMDAFGSLSRAAGPFIDALGEGIGGLVDDFSAWIKAADESGDLDRFFERAGEFFRDVLAIGGSVASIIGSIFGIIFRADDRNPGKPLDSLKDALDRVAKWLDDPANQEKVASFFGKIEDFFLWVKDEAIPTVVKWGTRIGEWADRLSGWADKAIAFKDRVVGAVDAVAGAVAGLPGRISAAAHGMWDGIKESFRSALNWIIGKWNGLRFTVGGGSFLGVPIPSATLGVPPIPFLARGGVIEPTPGGRLAVLGEAGKREIATPEDLLRRIVREETGGQDQGPQVIENHIHIGDEVTRVVRTEVRESNRALKRSVLAGAGAR
jgi:hypothetical protein